MSAAALERELERLQRCVSDMDRLAESTQALGKKVTAKASSFAGVAVGEHWGGAAAREFGKELTRTRQQVERAAEHAQRAVGVIHREIALTQAEILKVRAELAAARAWKALQRATEEQQ